MKSNQYKLALKVIKMQGFIYTYQLNKIYKTKTLARELLIQLINKQIIKEDEKILGKWLWTGKEIKE